MTTKKPIIKEFGEKIDNALRFHEIHLFYNPKCFPSYEKMKQQRGIMRMSEVKRLLRELKKKESQ